MRARLRSPWLALLALLAPSCGAPAPPPGYGGPVPSPAAQRALAEIEGEVLDETEHGLGGGALALSGFAVIPNSETGKGPVVLLTGADGARHYLPVETDGDVADLCRRVTGRQPAGIAGPTSAAYRARMDAGGAPAGGG